MIWYAHRREDGTIASVHEELQEGYAEEPIADTSPEFPSWAKQSNLVPQEIPNWKAHAILEINDKLEAVNAIIESISDPMQRKIVRIGFDRADPIPRSSPNLNRLLKQVGMTDADIDKLFIDGNKLTA